MAIPYIDSNDLKMIDSMIFACWDTTLLKDIID